MPALFISTSRPPSTETVWASASCTAASEVTSSSIVAERPPCSAICAAVVCAPSALRSAHITAAPSEAIRTAHSRPIPEPAPVISATRPSSLSIAMSPSPFGKPDFAQDSACEVH